MCKSIETIIFDLDGTLLDSSPDVLQAMNLALKQLRLPPVTLERVKKGIGVGSPEFVKIMLPKDRLDLAENLLHSYLGIYEERCTARSQLYPGVHEVLAQLADHKLVLTTNKPMAMTNKTLNHFGLRDRFAAVVGPEDVERLKPHPDMLLKALQIVDSSPERALIVGDTENDILAGRRAGIATCAVTYGYGSRESLQKLQPDFLIDRFEDLLGITRRLHRAGS